MDNRPIGFFDSGLGGLTCIPHLMKALPGESIIYFGDTARTPYGSKAENTIRHFACEITDFLAAKDVKAIVIACNTVSAVCIDDLRRRRPDIPILGIISPAARRVAGLCDESNHIGIIGTKATVGSNAYRRKITEYRPGLTIHETACPAFVPLIEEGIIANDIMDLTIKYYLDRFMADNGIDTLVLGCTHYPLIRENIAKLFPAIRIIDPSEEIMTSISAVLRERDMFSDASQGLRTFYASDLSENFIAMIHRIFRGTGFTVAFKSFDL
ncbi:MAG: glutamate racemase [Clostridiales Family XIII bacterium]|jgi:glutamate racemase|nr:glutamate racemase [Clostridiales Family XIII bacterium]